MTDKSLRIMIEASGSLTSAYMIRAIKDAGHVCVGSDITAENAAVYLADEYVRFPPADDVNLWDSINHALNKLKIDLVLPTLDESIIGWARMKTPQVKARIICSPITTLEVCLDKWKTYQFFIENEIPTALTSLEDKYDLIKPRFGRGSRGVTIKTKDVDMNGQISQEVIVGTEYTIDVLCDDKGIPIYIVPRKRMRIKDGKSISAIVELDPSLVGWTQYICSKIQFSGPINIQCFKKMDGTFCFIEINPRLAGGAALAFAASENWINAIVKIFVEEKTVLPREIIDGMKMERYYSEVFIR